MPVRARALRLRMRLRVEESNPVGLRLSGLNKPGARADRRRSRLRHFGLAIPSACSTDADAANRVRMLFYGKSFADRIERLAHD